MILKFHLVTCTYDNYYGNFLSYTAFKIKCLLLYGITNSLHKKSFIKWKIFSIMLHFYAIALAEPTVYTNSKFGDGYGPIVYSYMQCNGWEKGITDCPKYEYLQFTCLRTSLAGVLCHDGSFYMLYPLTQL